MAFYPSNKAKVTVDLSSLDKVHEVEENATRDSMLKQLKLINLHLSLLTDVTLQKGDYE